MIFASDAFWNNLPATLMAAAGLAAAIVAAVKTWRSDQKTKALQDDLKVNTEKTEAGNTVIREVKKLVNGQQTEIKEEVAGLRNAMEKHDIECPPQAPSVKP